MVVSLCNITVLISCQASWGMRITKQFSKLDISSLSSHRAQSPTRQPNHPLIGFLVLNKVNWKKYAPFDKQAWWTSLSVARIMKTCQTITALKCHLLNTNAPICWKYYCGMHYPQSWNFVLETVCSYSLITPLNTETKIHLTQTRR